MSIKQLKFPALICHVDIQNSRTQTFITQTALPTTCYRLSPGSSVATTCISRMKMAVAGQHQPENNILNGTNTFRKGGAIDRKTFDNLCLAMSNW